MIEPTLRKLSTPLADEVSDLLLIQADLHHSIAALKLWQEKYARDEGVHIEPLNTDESSVIGRSLFRDAVVQFVGCFESGVKYSLSAEAIYGKENLPSYQWFKDQRDAYAAHKFGAQRQCVVGVIADPNHGRGWGQLMALYRGQSKTDGPRLIGFMQTALSYVEARLAELGKKLFAAIDQMSQAQIEALEIASVHTLAMHEVRMTRKKIQEARKEEI